MSNSIMNIQPELKHALEIFIKELDSHIFYLQNTLQSEPLLTDIDNKKHFEHRFHTIRGGAGFLQLHEIQQCATEGEKMMREPQAKSDSEDELRSHLERIVETLNVQMADLREAFGEKL